MLTEPLFPTLGTRVSARPGEEDEVFSLDPERIGNLLQASGVILFRGFRLDNDRFTRFTLQFGPPVQAVASSTLLDQMLAGAPMDRNPVSDDRMMHTVNAGTFGINAHSEATYSPFSPDILWFYCKQPSAEGGRTGVCDGISLLQDLTAPARDAFTNMTFRRTGRVPKKAIERLMVIDDIEDAILQLPTDRRSKLVYEIDNKGEFSFEYTHLAVREAKFSGCPAFSNNFLSTFDYETYDPQRSPVDLDPKIGQEAMKLARESMLWLDWRKDDILMIDNTRIMHGREPFPSGQRRDILVRMTMPTEAISVSNHH
jgi:alpha-ketoglutarate-dependent taurine dioxygenase